MKIQTLSFTPRGLPPTSPQTPKPHVHEGLGAENPLLFRAVDTAHVGLELLHHAPEGRIQHVGTGVQALVGVGALAWGIQKLQHGETALDRLEAAGTLALAAESGLHVYEKLRGGHAEGLGKAALPLAMFHHATELVVGGADFVRGRQERDSHRALAGLAQMAVAGSLAAAHFIPGAALPLHLAGAAAQVTRQFLIANS